MIAFRVVSGVTQHFIMRLPEWANSFVLLLYGQTLLQPGDAFDRQAFSVMAHYASERSWGVALVGLGAVRLAALILNGTFARFAPWSVRIRALTATLCCFAWFCLSLSLYLGDPALPGWKTYAAHLAVDIIMAIYLGGQAGRVDRELWHGRPR